MKRSRVVVFAVLALAVVVAGVLSIGNREPAPAPQGILASDLLAITLRDLSAPNTTVELFERVDDDGRIALPLVGPMDASGLTLDELANRVNIIYAEKNLMRSANAQVKRIEPGGSPSINAARMRAGDHVRIRIWDLVAPNVVSQVVQQVADDGTIGLPLVGKRPVAGLSEIETEAAIVKAYSDGRLIQNAIVEALRISDEEAKTSVTGSSQ